MDKISWNDRVSNEGELLCKIKEEKDVLMQ